MDIGLQTLSYPSQKSARGDASSAPGPLNPAVYLHINIDVTSDGFGSISAAVKDDQTSVLVVRDESLTDVPTVPLTAKALKGLTMVIMDYVHSLLHDTSLARQHRHNSVRLAIKIYHCVHELVNEYGSVEAVNAARGKEWRWGDKGEIVRM